MLDRLTVDQTQAATLVGPVLVLAEAGTGTTESMTSGVAHRVAARGIPGHHILAVTFTNKAAAEIRSRFRAALGEDGAPTWQGTFHGPGARQLRVEPEVAGLRPGFDIVDADDRRRMFKRVMKAMNFAVGDDSVVIDRDPLNQL